MAKRGLGIALLLTVAVLGLWLLDRDAPDRTVARDAPEVEDVARRATPRDRPTEENRVKSIELPPEDFTDVVEADEPVDVTKYVKGVVRNIRGEPVPGVRIVAWDRERLRITSFTPDKSGYVRFEYSLAGTTDEEGRFRIPVGTAKVRVGILGGDRVPAGDDLVLEFRGIAGRLRGVDGKPVERGVMLLRREGKDEIVAYADMATGGYFAFHGIEDGLYRLSYKTHRSGSETTTLDGARDVPGWRTDVELRMLPGDTIEGIVFDANGEPRQGVWVRTTVGTTLTGDTTGADGRFTVKGLDPSLEYRLTTWIRGYVPEIRDGIRAGTKDVRFTLDPGRRSTGRVVDASGNPVAKVRLHISPAIPLYPETDEGGRFDLCGLPEGPIEVRAGKQVFTFRAGDRDLVFVLE